MDGKNILFVLFLVVIFGGVIFFGIWMIRWQYSKADTLLENWATQNDYKLLGKENANFGDGPLGRRGAKTYVKYRIKIEDKNGEVRTGTAFLGDENIGVISDQVRVEWDN